MAEFIIPIWLIATIFLVVAFAYSSVGLGGGSSYTALMVVFGFEILSIPVISLLLNLIVTSIGSYNFIRHRHLRINLILPFIISSLPMAWVGGSLNLPRPIFQWLLLFSLGAVIIRIYWWRQTVFKVNINETRKFQISIIAGALLGFIAGVVGIGGGIILVPLILLLGLGTVKEAAACGAVFIWLNSLVGLVSRQQFNYVDITPYIPLIITVTLGGMLGSYIGANNLSGKTMEKLLGSIVVVAVFFLGRSLVFS